MVVGLPFVALAVSAGCWCATPAGITSSTATIAAVAPWSDSAGSAIAPPHAVDAVPPRGAALDAEPAPVAVPAGAPEAVPAGVPAGLPVPPGRLCRLVTGDRAPPYTI
jgi:hypothetical protein